MTIADLSRKPQKPYLWQLNERQVEHLLILYLRQSFKFADHSKTVLDTLNKLK